MENSENQALFDIKRDISRSKNANAEIDSNDEQTQELSTCPYPWRRYFARTLDQSLYGLIWVTFTDLVRNLTIENAFLVCIIKSYALIGIMLLLEPFLLSKYGTTLGKWIFGLSIRNLDGGKLTYKQAWHRTFGVFRAGLGYNIPIYDLLIMANCYGDCKSQRLLPWEKDTLYTIKDRRAYRIILYIALLILMGGINVLVTLQADMPLNKGNITPAEYYENCNDIMSQSKDDDYGRHLNEHGDWIENTKKSKDFHAILPLPKHQLIVKDGIVTGVRLELETDNDLHTFALLDQKKVAVMSFFAAQSKMNYFKLDKSDVLNKINNNYENYTFTKDGVKFTNHVELKGCKLKGDWIEPTEHVYYIHMVFTMERV